MASTSTAEERTPLLAATTTPPQHQQDALREASPQEEARPLQQTLRKQRTVTFDPNPVTRTISPSPSVSYGSTSSGSSTGGGGYSTSPGGTHHGPPMLAGINSKLRRRNGGGTGHSAASGGGPTAPSASGLSTSLGLTGMPGSAGGGLAGPKIGPQRSTKNAQKLKLLPEPDFGEEGPDEESGRDVYSQYTRIKDPTARRDAARLGKADRARLPRVSAYCTANRYQMDGLFRYLKGRGRAKAGANPKLIDECIYTPYNYGSTGGSGGRNGGRGPGGRPQERRHSTGEISSNGIGRHDSGVAGFGGEPGDDGQDATDWHGSESTVIEVGDDEGDLSIDIEVHTPEVFLFDYGVVVIWGMSLADERRFLKEIAKFETEKLAEEDVETEFFNFYYTREYQARMYNDFIALRDKTNYMTKLAISHALAQSVKTSLFEDLIASTIETCKEIPEQLALTGKFALTRTQINMQIGELFILRISVHLNGSVLDTPELFWTRPQLEPVYQAVRKYLEMDQRAGLLTERLNVIADLLAVLKDHRSHGTGERLEWIVIILIAVEILVAAINIVVDLWAGV